MEMVSVEGHGWKHKSPQKGGLRTLPFIMANEIFEKVASVGLLINMILYLTQQYHMDSATGATVLFVWSAASYFLPLAGAFLSDSYLGRFRVIMLGSVVSFMGMTLLWLTAMLPKAHPQACDNSYTPPLCPPATAGQLALLVASFALMSIGAGGIRPCSLAFGADQLRGAAAERMEGEKDPTKQQHLLQSYFNWYYASVGLSYVVAVTVIVYIQSAKGWKVGLGVPVVLMLLSALMFVIGSPLYVKERADRSVFTGLVQVIVAAARNRNVSLPSSSSDVYGAWYCSKGQENALPSAKLRFLNKACFIKDPKKDLKVDGTSMDPWKLCTVKQVEDLKSILRVLPIWSTGIVIANSVNQHSFPVLQALTMDRHLGRHFQIPAGSFVIFAIIALTIWIAIYDRLIVPHLAKFTSHPRGLTFKQRMGIGLILSCIATSVAAIVEHKRRHAMVTDNIRLTAMWLVPQYTLLGLSEAFNAIGQIEFFYSELPKGTESIAMALFALGIGVGNLLGSALIEIVHMTTRMQEDGQSWLANDLNRGHYDYYYWVLTCLGLVNIFWFWLCSWCYGKEGQNDGFSFEEE